MAKNLSENQKIAPEGYHYMSDGTLMANHSMQTKSQSTQTNFIDYLPLVIVVGFVFFLSIILTQFYTPNSSLNMVHDMSKMGNMFHDSWLMRFMDNLMGIWFLIFSLFKLIDINGFADGFATYDIIAKKIRSWGYIYPILEVLLGIAYLTRFNPTLTNQATVILLSLASIGIIQSMLKKQKIQCFCLGTILKVPLTTVSLIENLVMILMAIIMLIIM